ncbi:MAG: hypothetical protein AAF098_06750 [Pseudomonadota bacterium]
MARFTRADRLQKTWALLRQEMLNYQGVFDAHKNDVCGERALQLLSQLLREHGTDLDEAVSLASEAHDDINVSRTQKVAQFHAARVRHLDGRIEELKTEEGAATDGGRADEDSLLATAERRSQLEDLKHQQREHAAKFDQRAHGIRLTRMRSKRRGSDV